MINRDHRDHHIYRDEPQGQLGVQVKTFETSKDRANRAQSYVKQLQNHRCEWSEKRSLAD